MKNYQKQKRYAEAYDKLQLAIKNNFYYEAIHIEYNILEDRLNAVIAICDKKLYKDERILNISEKIKLLRNIDDNYVKEKISTDFLDKIITWKNKRNEIVHNLLNNHVSDENLKQLSEEGYELVKIVNNKTSQIIRKYKKKYQDRIYYQLRKDCYIRKIGSYGYVKSIGIFNDLLFDESGYVFLEALSRKPQNIDDLCEKISKKFININAKDIKNDVVNFYDALVDDGFLVKGNNISETIKNNKGFSYKNVSKVTSKDDYSPKNIRSIKNTQIALDQYFREHPFLMNFQFELTSKCNERCIHCYIPHEFKNKSISESLYIKTLNELKDMGCLGVTLSGGEPMAHPKFLSFLKEAKERDFYVTVLSNLNLMNDKILSELRKGNACGVQASLYSMNSEHHDYITTIPGSFEKTKNNILKLIENDIPVQINCPVMKANKDDVADVIQWGHEHKIRVNVDYAIMAEYDHRTDNLANRLSPEECADVIESIILNDEEYRKDILSDSFIDSCNKLSIDPNSAICGVGINTCCMVSNGDIYPCPGWQSYKCGNVAKDSLINIWNNSKEMNYIRNIRNSDLSKCLKCKNRAFCSPCMSRFANESKTGNPLEVAEHFCNVAKVNKKVVLNFITNKKIKKEYKN